MQILYMCEATVHGLISVSTDDRVLQYGRSSSPIGASQSSERWKYLYSQTNYSGGCSHTTTRLLVTYVCQSVYFILSSKYSYAPVSSGVYSHRSPHSHQSRCDQHLGNKFLFPSSRAFATRVRLCSEDLCPPAPNPHILRSIVPIRSGDMVTVTNHHCKVQPSSQLLHFIPFYIRSFSA
ncbi:uncharacterized protein BDW43DRAFT_278838 [Aspergillus alliaceus]|uniref:uncharacterized protein n=1 Tax=Petromyces alliaceus TaxID=209559 RepID=UPI0012A43D67|nr:uncharacterized protein BDW43DRAFT_278838 [Aspergillus alliaceus]KAB8232526.1 hypothetical protein BDW43DRAFT_278838 [Aspergillus alliaceus]